MMVMVYLPKTKGNNVNNVTVMLENYSKATKYVNSVVCSPGYMSKTEETIKNFVDKFKNKVLLGDINKNNKMTLLHGMNGSLKIKNDSVLSVHNNMLASNSLPISINEIPDHRKVICFYTPNLSDGSEKDDQTIIDELINNTRVNAILIGSSNLSNHTYFSEVISKGEADLFIFKNDDLSGTNNPLIDMTSIEQSRNDLKTISTTEEKKELEENPVLSIELFKKLHNVAIAECFCLMNNEGKTCLVDEDTYLKEIMKELLESGTRK